MNRRTALLLAVPLLGAGVVLGAMALRARPEGAPSSASRSVARARVVESPVRSAPAPALPKPAPEKDVAAAMDEARIRTTYQNYRTALATGNQPHADALYKVLARDRKVAFRLAQEDLSGALAEFDRSVARMAVDALGRL